MTILKLTKKFTCWRKDIIGAFCWWQRQIKLPP
jgi:hypothetical protein